MKSLNLYFKMIFLSFILISCQDVRTTSRADQFMMDDMILDQSSITHVASNGEVGEMAAGGYSVYGSQQWKNGIMPVAFDATVSQTQRNWFITIAQKWSPVTRVWIINRTNETDYLRVTNSQSGCFSEVGASPGYIRKLNLGKNCWTEGVTLHEIGHALGLMHEHQRPDRNSYISIDLNNVDPALHYAFALFSALNNATAYDFQSIMHYSQYAFSKNGKTTINTLSKYANFQNKMGIHKISASDQKTMADMYRKSFTDSYGGFSESYYLAKYPDVAEMVKKKQYKTGRVHFEKVGCREGRNPNLDFNELTYRKNNPDVATALNQGSYNGCAFLHFGQLGRAEGRKGNYAQ